MKNKFKRALAVASSIVSLSTMSQVKASGDIIKETEFLGLSSLGLLSILYGAKHQGIDSKYDNSDSKFNKISKSSQNEKNIKQEQNIKLVDNKFLKSVFEKRLEKIKNNDLYSDIGCYQPEENANQKVILNDIVRKSTLEVDESTEQKLKQTAKTVLRYVHGKSKIDYYQGYCFVCIKIAFMINEFYSNLENSIALKLCTDIYFDILPTMSSYSQLLYDIMQSGEEKVPKFFENEYVKLKESLGKKWNWVTFADASMEILYAWGMTISKSVGDELVGSLLLYVDEKISKEELECKLANAISKRCEKRASLLNK